MGRIILCVGSYAKTPYYIERSGLQVYSIEEICYFLCENVVLLDQEIINQQLVQWISTECQLEELAKELNQILQKKDCISEFINAILSYTHYGTKEEIEQILQTLKECSSLNIWEKKKTKIDFYAKTGKYEAALREYTIFLNELEKAELDLKWQVLHNMGVIYANIYYFQKAAYFFKIAYEGSQNEESKMQYFAAKRMLLKKDEYLSFLAEESDCLEVSLQLEKRMDQVKLNWEFDSNKEKIEKLGQLKNDHQLAAYTEAVEELVNQWKDAYRMSILGI